MYEREVDVPRLVASYRLADEQLPQVLAEAAGRAQDATQTPFNSVGLNYLSRRTAIASHLTTTTSTRSSPDIPSP